MPSDQTPDRIATVVPNQSAIVCLTDNRHIVAISPQAGWHRHHGDGFTCRGELRVVTPPLVVAE